MANQTLGGPELDLMIGQRIQQGQGRFYILVPSIEPEHEATEWHRGFAVAEDARAAGATSDAARQAVDDAVRRRETKVGQG